MDRKQLKAMAKEQIRGNIGVLFLCWLILSALSLAAGLPSPLIPVVGLAVNLLVSAAITLSFYAIYLNLTKGQIPKPSDSFIGFYDFWSAFKLQFLGGVFVFLWMLLFIIPGIIASFSYSMAFYILAENKGMSAREALSRSKEMMRGRKMDYFILSLSFIGWGLLGMITFGIAYIWVIPYMLATYANFYNSIKDNAPPVAEFVSPETEA